MKKSASSIVINRSFLILFSSLIILFAGCSDDEDENLDNNNGNGNPAITEVTMMGLSFTPENLTVPAGTRVTWRNTDGMTHTVTSDSGIFDSGNLSNNAVYSYTFDTPGVYPYFCRLHPGMTGTITVE